MDNIIKVHSSDPKSCKDCVSRSEPIPDECPLWKLDPDLMIKEFNSDEGTVHEGCPYVEEFDLDVLMNKLVDMTTSFASLGQSMYSISKDLTFDIKGLTYMNGVLQNQDANKIETGQLL